MKFVDRNDTIQIPPIDKETLHTVHYSIKNAPFVDNKHIFLGYTRCTSNVLADADRNHSAVEAMYKDAR